MGNEFALYGATPSRTAAIRNEIAEYEAVAFDDLPERYTHRPLKNWPVEHERVKLAVLAARIDFRRKIRKKSLVEWAPGERRIENCRVDTGHDGPESVLNEPLRKFCRVALPDRKKALEVPGRQLLFAIDPKIFQKDVSESHALYALCLQSGERIPHFTFVDRVGGTGRNGDFRDGNPYGVGLAPHERAANAVHGYPVVRGGYRREQLLDDIRLGATNLMQRNRAVLAPAEAHGDGFTGRHRGLFFG